MRSFSEDEVVVPQGGFRFGLDFSFLPNSGESMDPPFRIVFTFTAVFFISRELASSLSWGMFLHSIHLHSLLIYGSSRVNREFPLWDCSNFRFNANEIDRWDNFLRICLYLENSLSFRGLRGIAPWMRLYATSDSDLISLLCDSEMRCLRRLCDAFSINWKKPLFSFMINGDIHINTLFISSFHKDICSQT